MSIDIDSIVVGAGVVGLAVARQLAQSGREVLIVESEKHFGTQTSARNSEVIHAGIYYEKDSLKARLCVRGKELLYAYCESRALPHKRCGKLIVATNPEQVKTLASIQTRARNNGVEDLLMLNASEVCEIEPQIVCEGALLSPSTGIIDSHSLMLSFLGDAENAGAVIAYDSKVLSVKRLGSVDAENGFEVAIGGDEPMVISCKEVINSAGHGACQLAREIEGLDRSLIPEPVLAKGNYFQLQGKAPVSRLIYPVPEEGGLGVHITLDLAGQVRFGPDVEWLDKANYKVDPGRADSFYEAVRSYWPALPDNSLLPDYAGLRPKIQFGEAVFSDFVLQGPQEHDFAGLVNLFGIESPGLTAGLAIAEEVEQLLSI